MIKSARLNWEGQNLLERSKKHSTYRSNVWWWNYIWWCHLESQDTQGRNIWNVMAT